MTNELEGFRKDFGLKDQIRRAAVSSIRNILFSTAVAAIIASPDLKAEESVYSSI